MVVVVVVGKGGGEGWAGGRSQGGVVNWFSRVHR